MSCVTKIPYACCTTKFQDHYTNHKGYGLGGIFRRLFRAALPFLVKGGKALGKEVLITGTNVMNDVVSGEDIKIAAKNRSKEAGKNLARKAIGQVQSLMGKGKYKRKRKQQKKIISSKVQKARGRDIFDA